MASGTGEAREGVIIRGRNNGRGHEVEDWIGIILKRRHMDALEEARDEANGLLEKGIGSRNSTGRVGPTNNKTSSSPDVIDLLTRLTCLLTYQYVGITSGKQNDRTLLSPHRQYIIFLPGQLV